MQWQPLTVMQGRDKRRVITLISILGIVWILTKIFSSFSFFTYKWEPKIGVEQEIFLLLLFLFKAKTASNASA